MRRLSLAAAASLAIIAAPTDVMPAIVIGAFLLQAVDGIINVFKYWREVTTVRFWIVSVVLALVCVAALKLR